MSGASNTTNGAGQPASEPIIQLTGRTQCDRIVVFDGNRRLTGHIIPVDVFDVTAHTLLGVVVTDHVGPEVFALGT